MRSAKLKFILIVSLLLNFSLLAAAGFQYFRQSGYWASPFGIKIKKERFIFEELPLRPDQAKAMRGKAVPFRAEIDKKRLEIARKKKELLTVMRADNPNEKAIDDITAEISSMQEDMQRLITAHILEEKALLDKKQQEKFLDLLEKTMTEGGQAECPQAKHH